MTNYVDLLREFFVTDFKLRYKHSYLGFLWVILKPLSYYVILNTVWTSLFKTAADYSSYLLIGILTITYFTEGVAFGLQSLFNKAHIILKVNFPREIVVFSSIAIATVNFFINFGIYTLFRVMAHQPIFSATPWYFFWGIALLTILLLGISFFISIISVRYHDIKHLVELVLQLVFWATPVFYTLNQLPDSIANLLNIGNPLVVILDLVRAGVLPVETMPHVEDALVKTFIILCFTYIGFVFFKKSLLKIAEYF